MSCPHAAGLAALMLEKNPSLSPAGLDSIMELSAVDLHSPGKDNLFGSGRLDAVAAVNMVPLALTANLVPTDIELDPNGDGVLDPGQTSEIIFELTNNSIAVDATGVEASLAVVANPFVHVNDGEAGYPTIAMNYGSAWNTDDTFSVDVAAEAPQGYEFTILLTVTADGGFEQVFDIPSFVGLPDFLTHNVGNVYCTVTDQGIIGYMNSDQIAGDGMGQVDGGSALFIGSLWGGVNVQYICNRDFDGTAGAPDIGEWEVQEDPNGRMQNLGAAGSDQTFISTYTDSGHESARDVLVEQTSLAWATPPDNDFVIIEYHLTNNGSLSMPTYWAGMFTDWDVGDSAANRGGVDEDRQLIWIREATDGPHYGTMLVGDAPFQNVTFIHNPTYIYPLESIDDGNKVRFLRGIWSFQVTPTADDWSSMVSAGPLSFMAGQDITVAFAMVYGENEADLLANADAAAAAYNPGTPVSENLPIKVFQLEQNHPNPFNPSTTIKFTVAHEGHVRVAVYDVSGRLVKTLVDEVRAAGEYPIIWDGTDSAGNRMSSGTYLYRYSSAEETATRKMTLVK